MGIVLFGLIILKSAENDAWRLTVGWEGGTAAHTYQWHWSVSRACEIAETAICTFFFFYSSKKSAQCSNIKSSQGCFDELGSIWDEWAISVSFSLKTAADEAGDQRKGPFIALRGSDPKKGPFVATRTFPQGPQGAMFLPGLESQCTVALAPGTCWARNTLSFILIFPHTFMYGLVCLWAAVNISSHCIIHMLHLMQYSIHVLCTTNVCTTAYKCVSAYSW